jgi:streptomycin 6-kinase
MTHEISIPERLSKTCSERPEWGEWLARVPATVRELADRWALSVGEPFTNGTAAWVAPAQSPGGAAVVLKLGLPHMEALQEIAALRFWNGDPTARLLEADEGLNAMLLERAVPGELLRTRPEPEQDVVIARPLNRAWRRPVDPHPFRPLSAMVRHWCESSLAGADRWPDPDLTREGLRLMEDMAQARPGDVLLATDLHAGNVLSAERESWLAKDPKPFVGDPAYDATQHLLNSEGRFEADPLALTTHFAGLLGVDVDRVRLWAFARLAVEPRDWSGGRDKWLATALKLAP